jgi:hypothetical protein
MASLPDPGEAAVEEDELGLGIGLDEVHQIHGSRALDTPMPGMHLEGQFVLGAQFDQTTHDEVLKVFDILR